MIDARMPRLLEPMRRHDERVNDWAIVRGKNSFGNGFDLSRLTKTRRGRSLIIPFRGPGAATYPGPEDLFLLMAASRAEFRFFERPLTFRRRGDKVSLCNVPHTWCSPPSACAKVCHRKEFLASFILACSQHRHDVWSPSASWACAKHWQK
jgi:hypothetical protein